MLRARGGRGQAHGNGCRGQKNGTCEEAGQMIDPPPGGKAENDNGMVHAALLVSQSSGVVHVQSGVRGSGRAVCCCCC